MTSLVAAIAVHSNKLNVTATCGCVPAASDCLGTLIETTRMIETYLFRSDWVLGQREVVSIEGDVGTLVLRSVSASVTDTLPNPLDVPQNVALYSRAVCIYITSMLSFVVILASLAVIASVSCVEVCNVLVLPRVVGIVWTGRPLLFARSVVALCWGSLDRWGS
ncbi:hypothetical protein DYB30_001869 [Aphanomyces astaci]|uniref:Transmembrane protein n=1 Tax=Aphanomyces astaci TaxID=112090 RepID=A0A397EAL5_APHAT|nr:hypothetical protein DYB30_001869 [Aphanomyces astaci]RHY52485.1 hypothetical protein DYB34_001302 [Aphanomyces astaci]RHY78323.1 hypothetical protein DYB38_002144 [Aphanomyces astaci]RHZ33686.1 hypothetical protein DYB31_001464 [Aphanomyces astaci]